MFGLIAHDPELLAAGRLCSSCFVVVVLLIPDAFAFVNGFHFVLLFGWSVGWFPTLHKTVH